MSLQTVAPFEGPRLKVARGRHHIHELASILATYGQRLVVHYEPVDGNPSLKRLAVSEPLPPEIPLIIGDAAHNLRAALDIMMCDIARCRGKSTKNVTFPFGIDAETYKERIDQEPIHRLGANVQRALLSIKAYRGGNSILRGLHDLDVDDKHKIIIPLLATSFGKGIVEMALDSALKQNPNFKARVAILGGTPSLDIVGSEVAAEFADEHYPNPYCPGRPATVLFAYNQPSLSGMHIIPTLEKLSQIVLEIIESFASEFGCANRETSRPLVLDN